MIHTTAPIARWARVPNETLSGTQQIGVVAFHKDGIKEVRYRIVTSDISKKTAEDLTMLLSDWGTTATRSDLNADGVVDAQDMSILLANFGTNGHTFVITESNFNHTTKIPEYSFDYDFDTLADGEIIFIHARVEANDGSVLELTAPFDGFNAREGLYALPLQKTWTSKTWYVSQTGNDANDGVILPFATYAKAVTKVTCGDTIQFSDGEHILTQPPNQSGLVKPGIGKWLILKGGCDTTLWANGTFRLAAETKFENIAFDLGRSGYITNKQCWWDNCRFVSPSNHAWWDEAVRIHGAPSAEFKVNTKNTSIVVFRSTDVSWHYFSDCSLEHYECGYANSPMVRNSTIRRIWGDALKQANGVYNVDVSEQFGWMSDVHTDTYQLWNANNNIIVYGVNAHGLESVQGIFIRVVDSPRPVYEAGVSVQTMLSNAAFIDCTIEHTPKARDTITNWGGSPWTQFRNKFNHILLQNMRLTHQRIFFGGTVEEGWEQSDHQNFVIRDSDLHWSFIEEMKSPTGKFALQVDGSYKHKTEGIQTFGCFNSVAKG